MVRNSTFFGLVALFFLVAGINLYVFRCDFSALAVEAFRHHDADLGRWQQWAQHYSNLFAALPWGARVGIQVEGCHSAGILLEKTSGGMAARRSAFLRRENPGVTLVFPPRTAEEMLASVEHTDPDAIWQMMKDRLYTRRLTIWNDPDIERLQKGGYLAFMRAIDTRPPDLDWPTLKAKYGLK